MLKVYAGFGVTLSNNSTCVAIQLFSEVLETKGIQTFISTSVQLITSRLTQYQISKISESFFITFFQLKI